LYLISPAGDRYSITEFPAGEGTPDIVDWSGDGGHALLTPQYGKDGDAISLDLHTGARTTIPKTGTLEYTRPDGKALLSWTSYSGSEPGTLKRIDMAGNEQFVYPTKDLGGAGQFSGDYLGRPMGHSRARHREPRQRDRGQDRQQPGGDGQRRIDHPHATRADAEGDVLAGEVVDQRHPHALRRGQRRGATVEVR
jgi:hypothetical protein